MKKQGKILPPTYFYLLMILSIVLHFLLSIILIIKPPFSYFGIIPIIIGIYLNIWADKLFKIKNTTVKPYEKPSQLITEGPFKISRHPMYLGMFLILLGIAIVLGSIITFIFPIIFILLMEIFFIPFEENNLTNIYGQNYIKYKKRVRRWI